MAFETLGKDSVDLKKLLLAIKQSGIARDTFFQTAVEVYDDDQPKVPAVLLKYVGTVAIPKLETFVVRDRFMVDTSPDARVKISCLGGNFRSWFLRKTESASDRTVLCCHTLRQASLDGLIIAELGGETLAETTLAQIYALMKGWKKGEVGVLLKNGCGNIFYVRDIGSVLRAVRIHWHGGGWRVYARSVRHPGRWLDGSRVFSRNS